MGQIKMNKKIQTLGLTGLLIGISGCGSNQPIMTEKKAYIEQTEKQALPSVERDRFHFDGVIDGERVVLYKTNEAPGTTAMSIMPISGDGSGRTYFDYDNNGKVDAVRICESGTICSDDNSLPFTYNTDISYDNRMSVDSDYVSAITPQDDFNEKMGQLKAMRGIE